MQNILLKARHLAEAILKSDKFVKTRFFALRLYAQRTQFRNRSASFGHNKSCAFLYLSKVSPESRF